MNRYDFYSNLQNYKKSDEIMHYGILGQKWGKRRWQNSDGTFNEAGKERYFGSGKVGGLFKKKPKYNPEYQNSDGSLTEEGKKFYENAVATEKDRAIKKNIDLKAYDNWKKEMDDNIFSNSKYKEELNKFRDDLGLRKGEYWWENDLSQIFKSDEKFYDRTALKTISNNAENIKKMTKALDDGNDNEYETIRNSFKTDEEKDICEQFVNDVRMAKDILKIKREIRDEVEKDENQNNIKEYLEEHKYPGAKRKLEYDLYDNGYLEEGDLKDYNNWKTKYDNKATNSIKEINNNTDKHFNIILDKLYNKLSNKNGELDVWDENHNKMTKQEFKKYMINQKYKLVNSGDIDKNGTVNLYLNDANLFWGHVFGVNYNPLTGEFNYHGIEG